MEKIVKIEKLDFENDGIRNIIPIKNISYVRVKNEDIYLYLVGAEKPIIYSDSFEELSKALDW